MPTRNKVDREKLSIIYSITQYVACNTKVRASESEMLLTIQIQWQRFDQQVQTDQEMRRGRLAIGGGAQSWGPSTYPYNCANHVMHAAYVVLERCLYPSDGKVAKRNGLKF